MRAVDFHLGVCGAGSAVSDVVYLVQATHQHFLLTATTTTRQPTEASVRYIYGGKKGPTAIPFCLLLFECCAV